MLIYHRPAPPKQPKRRSRSGCISCKEKKKKCNEERPKCDRCIEKGNKCEYEPVKPRKRRKSSIFSQQSSHERQQDHQSPLYYVDNSSLLDPDEYWDDTYEHNYDSLPSRELTDFEALDPSDIQADDEIVRYSPDIPSNSLEPFTRTSSPYPDLAMIAPSPVASPLLEFTSPVYSEFTNRDNRRALIDHFCNVLSHLIVFKEDCGNPFQQLVLPLSTSSSPVMNAIFALSSAHLEYRGIENQEKSLTFHNRALQGLSQLIEQSESNRDEIMAAIILLVYYEVLVQRGTANIVNGHLRGAMTMMRSQGQESNPTSLFLERAFRFYDVIAALSFGSSPLSPLPASLSSPTLTPNRPSNPLSAVDTLLGMATDLWPIIHRMSHLLPARQELAEATASGNTLKATVLRTEFDTTTAAIELALNNWSPYIPAPNVPEDDSINPRLQSIINNAEAYRHASIVYLHRIILLQPRTNSLVQRHTRLALMACLQVVDWAGPMSALLWPLFTAACEAIEESDRAMARRAFVCSESRQGMCNIGRAWEVVEEVWKRGEHGDWRQVCNERGFNIVFG